MKQELFLNLKMSEEAESENINYLRGMLYFSREILNLHEDTPLVELLRLRNNLTEFKHLTHRDEQNAETEEEENVIKDILDFLNKVIDNINKIASALNINPPNQKEIMTANIGLFKTLLKRVLMSISTASFANYKNWPQDVKNLIEA